MASPDDDYISRLERKKNIIELMEAGDWKKVLAEFDKGDAYREPLLVWIRPTFDSLKFIENCLIHSLGISKVDCTFITFL